MQYWITKSGYPVLDVARAYGMAALLAYSDASGDDSPVIHDHDWSYSIDFPEGTPEKSQLSGKDEWHALFTPADPGDEGPQWQALFLTNRRADKDVKRLKVREVLERHFDKILDLAKHGRLSVEVGRGGETLPGTLDPVGFKGLRGRTTGEYREGQMEIDELNWALGCFGGALAGRFVFQRNVGYFVVYPCPQRVRFDDYWNIRRETYAQRLSYPSALTAAAHYALTLASNLRKRAASGLRAAPRYNSVLFFAVYKTGNQWKPSDAGRLEISWLIDFALSRPHEAADVFATWDYLFRRGSVQGKEELALTLSEFMSNRTLENYERHVKRFLRELTDKVRREQIYSEVAMREVMALVEA